MLIKSFKQISKKDVAIAGGKGASLGEMTKAGLNVPHGFVVLAGAFDRFLEKTDLSAEIEAKLQKVKHKDINSISKTSAELKNLIVHADIPKDIEQKIINNYHKLFKADKSARYNRLLVAVRSSATAEDSKVASWAGELETYLNVTNKNLLDSVKKCWASLFTPRAIFYRFEKKLQKSKISVAVVIQKMVQSEISGICFTVHPVTKDRNQMIIEAGFGLGEAIVGGEITPDAYVIHKKDFSILDINVSEQRMIIVKSNKGTTRKKLSSKIGGKQKLTKRQIVTLAKICRKIEEHYKHPQDIEWALEKGKFYITQSRPITTL